MTTRRPLLRFLLHLPLLLFSANALVSPAAAEPAPPPFNAGRLSQIEAAIRGAVARKEIPGAVVWIEQNGKHWTQAYGNRMVDPEALPMKPDTLFDAASLTKVIATAPSVMTLIDDGKLTLDTLVSSILPEFTGDGKETVTVRQLLTHTSGTKPGIPREKMGTTYAEGVVAGMAVPLQNPPGAVFVYSDINYVLLAEIVRRVSGERLDDFAAKRLFRPLGMADAQFHPSRRLLDRIAPTTREAEGLVHGVAHDPTARRMEGVSGSAGLFITAEDTARYCRMLLAKGKSAKGKTVLTADAVKQMSTPQPGVPEAKRGAGFDVDSRFSDVKGDYFGPHSFGHTGWTGTALWIDPDVNAFVILLTNRNHPSERGMVKSLRHSVSSLAAQSMGLGPQVNVLQGIDRLMADNFAALQGMKIGLVTNHTGRNREGTPTIDLLHKAPGVKLAALFSPEHGIRGELDQAKIDDTTDAATGLPVYSLYGKTRRPDPAQFAGLDAVVFDIQDIGCRFYTYISTMLACMEVAAEAKVKFIVLDRINPIGGLSVEGPLLDGKESFTACHSLPVRHGLTVGELARLFAAERKLAVDLTVISVSGWDRTMDFPATALTWVNPSPNMRSADAATVYPGIGLLEFSNVSVGRGTETPFLLIGAPWINGPALALGLQAEKLPGLRIEAAEFTPDGSTFKDEACQGIRLTVTDRAAVASVRTGMAIARLLWRMAPETFQIDKVNTLLQHPATLAAIREGKSLAEITELWQNDVTAFRKRRTTALLYPENR